MYKYELVIDFNKDTEDRAERATYNDFLKKYKPEVEEGDGLCKLFMKSYKPLDMINLDRDLKNIEIIVFKRI